MPTFLLHQVRQLDHTSKPVLNAEGLSLDCGRAARVYTAESGVNLMNLCLNARDRMMDDSPPSRQVTIGRRSHINQVPQSVITDGWSLILKDSGSRPARPDEA